MQNDKEKQNKRQKRTQYMCKQMLRWLRKDMRFGVCDMYLSLGLPRRTYQEYEAGNRRIPAKVAAQIRELHKRDRELIAGIPARVDAAERGEVTWAA